MRTFFSGDEIIQFCKALSSRQRLDILSCIYEHKTIGVGELARIFGVSKAAITQNLKILAAADLVEIRNVSGQRDVRKVCFLREDHFVISLGEHFDPEHMYQAEISVGHYVNYKALPTCGLATTKALIGVEDDPRYFDAPERFDAGILWMCEGFVEYRLPNYLQKGQRPVEIQLSMELSSEAPGVAENWPSDIHFSLCGVDLGAWTSPGDFGAFHRGRYTPEWWFSNWNQYGLLKLLSINELGTFIDGLKISPVRIGDLQVGAQSELIFRISAPDDAKNCGGMTLYGRNFGNYNQGLRLRVIYDTVHEGDLGA